MNFPVTVPLLFYDLIARVVPGATFVFCFYVINGKVKEIITPLNLEGFSLFLVLVLLSYIIGFILTFFYDSICDKFKRRYLITFSEFLASKEEYVDKFPPIVSKKLKQVLSKEFSNLDRLTSTQINQIYYITSEWIMLKNMAVGAFLRKLDAVVHMLENLLIAFVLLSMLSIIYRPWFLFIFSPLACLIFFNLKKHNTIKFLGWANNFYVLNKIESDESEKQPKNKE